MNNASLPEKTQEISEVAIEEIPEAVRDTPSLKPLTSSLKRKWPFWKWLGLGIVAFFGTLWLNYQFGILVSQPPATPPPAAQTVETPEAAPTPSASVPTPSTLSQNPSELEPKDLLGHLPYEETSSENLQKITADGSIKLHQNAAQAFLEMSAAARSKGIKLVPISGFRTIADQEYLFFEIKAQRGQNAAKRAEVSAPPGYSEHHTGYAIDIGDRDFPDTDLSVNFEKTKAFQWLQKNAAYYSFELSFPPNNPQGVSYEPWHWRYVGNRHSLETFYKAKSKFPNP